jgi:hypothetical protein
MKAWFLFLLGTIAYFVNRYATRCDKTVDFSFKFWVKDNWPELLTALIFDLAGMIIIQDAGTAIDMSKFLSTLPIGVVLSGKLFLAFGCGAGLGKGAYELFKKKVKDAKN